MICMKFVMRVKNIKKKHAIQLLDFFKYATMLIF